MRYLKSYKIFEENISYDKEYIKKTLQDILLPISDLDYSISINDCPISEIDETTQKVFLVGHELVIRVVTYSDKPLALTDEIKNEFITMKDYLESEGFNSIVVKYVIDSEQNSEEFSEFIKTNDVIRNLLFVAKNIKAE
jgi:hypothetical protein